MMRLIYALLAAGTALSNSTSETVLASKVLPANHMQAGKVYHLDTLVRATTTNSTDTLALNVRVGPTTLTGTVVAAVAAVDVADNNVSTCSLDMVVRSVSATDGTTVLAVTGFCTALGAEGTGTARSAFEAITTLDSDAAIRIELTGTWSVASSSNSAQAESFILSEMR